MTDKRRFYKQFQHCHPPVAESGYWKLTRGNIIDILPVTKWFGILKKKSQWNVWKTICSGNCFSKNPKFGKKIRIGFFLSLEKLFLFYKNTSWEQNKNKKEF